MPNPQSPEDEARDERAEVLAEKVKDEAAAVTERVEQRAEALAERQAEERVEHRVEERIDQRADIQSGLTDITAAISTLIDHMDQSLPEERVQALLDTAISDARTGRRRLIISILSPVLIILAVVIGQVFQTEQVKDSAKNSAATADYVRGCIQHPERLTPEERRQLCGEPTGSGFFVNYLNCVFLIVPEDRTEANLNDCVATAQRETTHPR